MKELLNKNLIHVGIHNAIELTAYGGEIATQINERISFFYNMDFKK